MSALQYENDLIKIYSKLVYVALITFLIMINLKCEIMAANLKYFYGRVHSY